MPIYEYKCDNGHVFDVMQKMSDEALSECEECGAPAVRVLHSPAIHFKGSGFHNTDYGTRKGKANGADGSAESKSSDSGTSESKSSESKSDAKATAAKSD